jgi:O-antigen ligase
LSATLDDRLTVRIVQAIIALGGLVALIGIAFVGNHTGRVYGFWQPQSRGLPFGSFVNRNHFAGWMLMSTLVGFGYFTGLLTQAARAGSRSWHQRVVWLSSPDASRVFFVGAALIAMIASLLLSSSRSGIGCLMFGLAVIGVRAGAKGFNARGKLAYAGGLVLLIFLLVARVGADGMADRFATWRDDSLSGRLGAWRDSITLIRQYPVTGTGLNTFGVAMLFHQSSHLDELYVEAHNDYLQLAVEGGLLVGVPALGLLVVTVRAIRRRFREGDRGTHLRWIRVGAVTGMLAVAIQEAGDFSLQMPANAAMFCVLAAIALHRSGSSGAA